MPKDSNSFKQVWKALERRVQNAKDKKELDLLERAGKRLLEISKQN